MTVHVRYKSLYVSLPSSAKQQREMTKISVVFGTWTTTATFSYFHLELNAVVAYLVIGVPNRSAQSRLSLVKYHFVFYWASSSASSSSLLNLPSVS